jgi:hypothetical protein
MNANQLQALQDQVDRQALQNQVDMLAGLTPDQRRQWFVGILTRLDTQLDEGRTFEKWLLGLADVLRGRAAFGKWPKKWPASSSSVRSSIRAAEHDTGIDDD